MTFANSPKKNFIYLSLLSVHYHVFLVVFQDLHPKFVDLLCKLALKTTSISYGVINYAEKIQIYGEENVKKKISDHFSYFNNQHKRLSDKFVSIGSCSTMTTLCSVFQNLPFYNPKKIEGYEMSSKDVERTINFLEKQNDKELKKNACIGERYMLLKNGIKILKIILKKFPIENIIVTQKGLRDALTEEIILNYEKNKS